MVKRSQRRRAVDALIEKGLSKRKSCKLVGITMEGLRYKCKESELNLKMKTMMRELAAKYKRWGFPTIFLYIRELGYKVNAKRLHRIYKQENLQLRKRRRRQKKVHERVPMMPPTRPNQKWSMDFIHDSTADNRKLKCLIVVDEFTREALAIESDRSISGIRVCQILERLIMIYGKPEIILTDNGPEFTSKAYSLWALKVGIRVDYIQPGKPQQNAFAESFNSIFRDQCLNENWFFNLRDAKETIEEWKNVYNQIRPHGSLGGKTPESFRHEYGKSYVLTDQQIGV